MSSRAPDVEAQARRLLELLPAFQQWAVTRVERAGAGHDLSLRQFAALHAIREGAASPGQIARRWQVTPAVVTGIVDRLERRGFVRRTIDPVDRRRLRLVMTEAGLSISLELEQTLAHELAAQLAAAAPDELAALDRATDLLGRTLTALQVQQEPEFAAADGERAPDHLDGCDQAEASRPSQGEPSGAERVSTTPTARLGGGNHAHHQTEDATMATDVTNLPAEETAPEQAARTADAGVIAELNILDPHFMETAYDRYDELRAQGPVVRVRLGAGDAAETAQQQPEERARRRQETYFVTDYDAVVATLLNGRFSVDPRSLMTPEQQAQAPEIPEEFRPLARSLIGIDPPDHTRIRKLVQPSFTGRGMEALRPRIQATVDDLLDAAEQDAAARGETAPNRRLELIEALAYPFPVTVISDLLGIPDEDREPLRGWTENLLRVDSQRGRPEVEEETRAGLREFIAYLEDLFSRKRRQPSDDMISRMVLAEDEGDKLTKDETLATVFLMYLAGHVTTVNLVGNGIVALLSHPEELAKVQADPSLVKNLVEETLRYWGPVDFIGRRFATEPLDVAGTAIARGEQATVSLAAANRDPAKFAHPNVFDVDRENANRHVAFGKGIHVCLGAPLARVEAQIAFGTLIHRYPALRLAVPAAEITWSGSFLRGFRQVPLLF